MAIAITSKPTLIQEWFEDLVLDYRLPPDAKIAALVNPNRIRVYANRKEYTAIIETAEEAINAIDSLLCTAREDAEIDRLNEWGE